MTAVSATTEGFLAECLLKDANVAPQTPETTQPDRYGEVWVTGLADADRAASGTLTTITFKALKDITADTEITVFKTPIAAKSDMTMYVCLTKNGVVKGSGSSAAVTPTTTVKPQGGTTTANVTTAPSDVTAPTEESGELVQEGQETTPAQQTQATTAKGNSIQAPEGELVPMTTVAESAQEPASDNTGLVVAVVAAVLAVAGASVTCVMFLRKKQP